MDRLLSLESLIAMLQGMFAAYIAWSADTAWAYPMLVVALLGFISSLAVARFRTPDARGDAGRSRPPGTEPATARADREGRIDDERAGAAGTAGPAADRKEAGR